MCAHANRTASSSSSSPHATAGRSLLSRLTSPLRSRTRNLTDFDIRPAEPHRQYSPGDVVKGAVVLTVVKPIRVTHLTVALHGFVHVFKHANSSAEIPHDATLTASISAAQKSQYLGNGYASLFHDEVTLCGEGRLDVGIYEFNFELEFPRKGLPTSIDFERGTISYMIKSTITRPTSIAATTTCDRKVSLVEKLDIGLLRPPKPRTVSLEPISKRKKMRKSSSRLQASSTHSTLDSSGWRERAQPSDPAISEEHASNSGSVGLAQSQRSPPPSPIPSDVYTEVSGESVVSTDSTGRSARQGPTSSSHLPARGTPGSSSKNSSSNEKSITATSELLKSGFLPGDTIPLRISIQHTKRVKSMHGIIITLYRQSRIDSAPSLALFVDMKGKDAEKLKHEEYYPKSKTGLGGLSLTSAGSSSVFRKDLSQTFAPLFVDPATLTCVVNASVRVPADVFPTIQGVPGQMMSFKYHVEVVIDLGGKLAGQERFLPRIGVVSQPGSKWGGVTDGEDINHNILSAWSGNLVDTDHLRRERGVVASVFEVIVGTTDSARGRGRGVVEKMNYHDKHTEPHASQQDQQTDQNNHSHYALGHEQSIDNTFQNTDHFDHAHGNHEQQYDGHGYYAEEPDNHPPYEDGSYEDGSYENRSHEDRSYEHGPYEHRYTNPYHVYHEEAPSYVPAPEDPLEENLTDKDRVRRAEERLLPSQPPHISEDGPSSPRTIISPSAPLEAEDGSGRDSFIPPFLHNGMTEPPPIPSAPLEGELSHPSSPPAARALGGSAQGTPAAEPTEDKQELERRRLMNEASAPAEYPEEDSNAGEGSSRTPMGPSAPELSEEEEPDRLGVPGSYASEENLPNYRR